VKSTGRKVALSETENSQPEDVQPIDGYAVYQALRFLFISTLSSLRSIFKTRPCEISEPFAGRFGFALAARATAGLLLRFREVSAANSFVLARKRNVVESAPLSLKAYWEPWL
jgi:hypothetical protein